MQSGNPQSSRESCMALWDDFISTCWQAPILMTEEQSCFSANKSDCASWAWYEHPTRVACETPRFGNDGRIYGQVYRLRMLHVSVMQSSA